MKHKKCCKFSVCIILILAIFLCLGSCSSDVSDENNASNESTDDSASDKHVCIYGEAPRKMKTVIYGETENSTIFHASESKFDVREYKENISKSTITIDILGVNYTGTYDTTAKLPRSDTTVYVYTLDGTKWRITTSSSGAYLLTSKSGNWVLSASNGSIVNGYKLIQRTYTNDSDYTDEWDIKHIYYATVNMFFDNGYSVRYNESHSASVQNIDNYMQAISDIYLELLGLEINFDTAIYYNSPIDQCKVTVTSSNINTLCTHSIIHTYRPNVISSFKNAFAGNNTITNVYWSGHRITSTSTSGITNENRSCSSGTAVIMIELSSESERFIESTGVLMHELNHQYGARDHYHEPAIAGDDTTCKFKDICTRCGDNPRPSSCIMFDSRIDISESTVICLGCMEDIKAHLEDHHHPND